jgi:hypothetical protein
MSCETEMHVHFFMTAQEYFREALSFPNGPRRCQRIGQALECLQAAQRTGVPAVVLRELQSKLLAELGETAQPAVSCLPVDS